MRRYEAFGRRLASRLERGELALPRVQRALGRLWQMRARPQRTLNLPRGIKVVGVCGATLGGSGATPFAVELARGLSALGARVALVSSGYRAGTARALQVLPGAEPREVGDEACLAVELLSGSGVEVLVAPRSARLLLGRLGAQPERGRRAALELAHGLLGEGGVVVVDGLLQTFPERLAASVLVLDAAMPWGSGACPPAGDLRAAPERLLRACDHVVALARGGAVSPLLPKGALQVSRSLCGLRPAVGGALLPLSWLEGREFSVALAIARPERVLEQLAALGLAPSSVHFFSDHHGLGALLNSKKYSQSNVWLTTRKCWSATSPLSPQPHRAANLWLLEEALALDSGWIQRLYRSFTADLPNPPQPPIRALGDQ